MRENPFDKLYEPKKIEEKWYQFWENKGYFTANPRSKRPPYVIVMPPPNITGALHLGHALTATIQDVLIRWKRMLGFNVLWLPGTDHAGIATQNMVERELAKEGTDRHKMGRDKFIERVWQWRTQYGRTIMMQQKRFGISCDWTREHFTMDEDLSRAVREAFVTLYEKGLIYRGDYLINGCPRCESALSDLEVTHTEKEGKLWYINYPLEDGSGVITVATTRPETMLGDSAVAVHPDDDRYKRFIGKKVKLPLTDRSISIISDKYVDPSFGSGAVKITPGHDFNDFEVGKRHGLLLISVLDSKGQMNANAGKYQGLDRFQARKEIVRVLEEKGFLNREEIYKTSIGYCSRCQTVVEPYHSTQWFVKTKLLAKPAIDAVKKGRTKIVPEGWEKTYFNWMENITDWCISRQIWWGHRIPAWYCQKCSRITVAKTDPSTCVHCKEGEIVRDADVLDTWFSSALWPFSTLGWPKKTKDLKVFYPSTVMETGFDILFFWVARMMMMGIYFMKKPPFQYVYLHAMVRDPAGQKMSKSKGNVQDPLDLIDEFGSDALRFTLASLAAPGRDVKLSRERIIGYRNFINKIWNAARFIFMNLDPDFQFEEPKLKDLSNVDRWIITRFFETAHEVEKHLQNYRLDEATRVVYHFTWHEFCDWYIELTKPLLRDAQHKKNTQHTLVFVLKGFLKLLHPFIPFVTEEIWQALPGKKEESIMISSFPTYSKKELDPKAKEEIITLMTVVDHLRNIRGEHAIPPSKQFHVTIIAKDRRSLQILEREKRSLETLAKLSSVTLTQTSIETKSMVVGTVGFAEILIPMTELFDVTEEKKRLEKELTKLNEELEFVQKRLSQKSFLERAPKEVVEKDKARVRDLEVKEEKLKTSLDKMRSL